jgi:phosphonate transport system substrate-binding protein
MRKSSLCRSGLVLASILGAWSMFPAAPVGAHEETVSGRRDPALDRSQDERPRAAPPVLFARELAMPDTLGVGRVSEDVAADLPAVEALSDILVTGDDRSAFVRARPVLARDLDEMAEFLQSGIVDLLSAEPMEAIHAVRSGGAAILLRERRGEHASSATVVFVREDSPIRRLSELVGGDLALGRGANDTAHLLPLAAVRAEGLGIARVRGPGGEPPPGQAGYFLLPPDTSVLRAVWRKVAEAGAVSTETWEREEAAGNTDGLRILRKLAEFPQAFVLTGPACDEAGREALRRALLDLPSRPGGKEILDRYGSVTGFEAIDEETARQISRLQDLYDLIAEEPR